MIAIGIRFGLFAAAILIVVTTAFHMMNGGEINLESGELVGYATMAIALSMIYFAMRTFRLQQPDQTIGFGNAIAIGAVVSVLATIAWVGVWEVLMAGKMEEFMVLYSDQQISTMTALGASAAEIAQEKETLAGYQELYKVPAIRWVMGAGEILPLGLVVTLIFGFMKSRRKPHPV
jgi:hypothetical protein